MEVPAAPADESGRRPHAHRLHPEGREARTGPARRLEHPGSHQRTDPRRADPEGTRADAAASAEPPAVAKFDADQFAVAHSSADYERAVANSCPDTDPNASADYERAVAIPDADKFAIPNANSHGHDVPDGDDHRPRNRLPDPHLDGHPDSDADPVTGREGGPARLTR